MGVFLRPLPFHELLNEQPQQFRCLLRDLVALLCPLHKLGRVGDRVPQIFLPLRQMGNPLFQIVQ